MGTKTAETGLRRVRGVHRPGRVRRGEAGAIRGRPVRGRLDAAVAGQLRGNGTGLRETRAVPVIGQGAVAEGAFALRRRGRAAAVRRLRSPGVADGERRQRTAGTVRRAHPPRTRRRANDSQGVCRFFFFWAFLVF